MLLFRTTQTIGGRAGETSNGKAIMYADKITGMQKTIDETEYRRKRNKSI
jgi:excinuclease UvrABC helicase subunit UvrB